MSSTEGSYKEKKDQCKNCGSEVEGNYCSSCGQKSSIGRIDLSSFISDISETILQVDKGFFFTLKQLFLRPGKSIQDYLEGKRKNYFKPLGYLMILSTIYFFVSQSTQQSTLISASMKGVIEGASGNSFDTETPTVLSWFYRNYAYTILLLLPVFSFASFLAFRKYKKNYLEHMVINSFITGQQAVFSLAFALLSFLVDYTISDIFLLLVPVLYNTLVFYQLFSEGSRVMNIVRTIATYAMYCILSIVILAAAITVAGMM